MAQTLVDVRRVVAVALAHLLPRRGCEYVPDALPLPAAAGAPPRAGASFAERSAWRQALEANADFVAAVEDQFGTHNQLRLDARPGLSLLVLGPHSNAIAHVPQWHAAVGAARDAAARALGALDELVIVVPDALLHGKHYAIIAAADALRREAAGAYVRVVPYAHLIMSVADSVNVQQHDVVPYAEAAADLGLVRIAPDDLPQMFATDPMALWCGARHRRAGQPGGDAVRITCAAETQPVAVRWRRCVAGPLVIGLDPAGTAASRARKKPDDEDGAGSGADE